MYSEVLIVDDSGIDRRLSEMIIKIGAFSKHVTSCTSVDEGVSYLHSMAPVPEKLPEIILLDVNMPVKDGFDFLDAFLELPQYVQQQSTIFMISATNSPSDLQRIKTYPIVRKFFFKPLSLDILDKIRELLEPQPK